MNADILNDTCKEKLFYGYNDQVTDNDDDISLIQSFIMMPQVALNPSTNATTAAFKKLVVGVNNYTVLKWASILLLG